MWLLEMLEGNHICILRLTLQTQPVVASIPCIDCRAAKDEISFMLIPARLHREILL